LLSRGDSGEKSPFLGGSSPGRSDRHPAMWNRFSGTSPRCGPTASRKRPASSQPSA